MRVSLRSRCLVCNVDKPEPTYAATGQVVQEWQWFPWTEGRVAPFCSTICISIWMNWPEDERLTAIFGNVTRARTLLHLLETGRIKRDSRGATAEKLVEIIEVEPNQASIDKCKPKQLFQSGKRIRCPDCDFVQLRFETVSYVEVTQ